MSKKPNIWVTGGNGQVGMELRRQSAGECVFTTRDDLDITNTEAVLEFCQKGQFDWIINCAAFTAVDLAEAQVDKCFEVNVEALKNLAAASRSNQIKFIHLSSDYVYHPKTELAITEEDDCNPQGIYAKSKLAGDQLLLHQLEEVIILRTSWVYSSFGKNFVKTMLRLGAERDTLKIVNDQIGSPTYAGDIASTIMHIIRNYKGQRGIYHFSNLGFISWAEFAETIFELQNLKVDIQRIPTSDYPTPAPRPLNSRLIKSKIADDFSIELQHWRRSLKKCLEEIDN